MKRDWDLQRHAEAIMVIKCKEADPNSDGRDNIRRTERCRQQENLEHCSTFGRLYS